MNLKIIMISKKPRFRPMTFVLQCSMSSGIIKCDTVSDFVVII